MIQNTGDTLEDFHSLRDDFFDHKTARPLIGRDKPNNIIK